MFKHAFALTSLIVLAAGSAFAGDLQNGSFEDGNFVADGNNASVVGTNGTSITGWTVYSAEVAWIQNGNTFGVAASDGERHLDLTSYPGVAGGVQQTIDTFIGGVYTVTFDIGSRAAFGDANMLVTAVDGLGNVNVQTYKRVGTEPSGWDAASFEFTARESSTTLQFMNIIQGNYTGLDNVKVRGTPTPGALAIFGLAGLRSRRRR